MGKGDNWDVIVVGGSFAGLSAAMQLARARRRVLVFDSGEPRNRFAKKSHGFLGQDGKSPAKIIAIGRRQLSAYKTVSLRRDEVRHVERTQDDFVVIAGKKRTFTASRIVLATGMTDELPTISGINERWGVTVLHCPYCHGYEVADRQLGVIAQNDFSIHQAALVADWGPVTLFMQRRLELTEEHMSLLARRNVKIENSPIVEFLGKAPETEAVRLQDGRIVTIGAAFIVPQTKLKNDLPVQLGCALADGPMGPYLRVDEMNQTSVKGVFAAGDLSMPMPNATLASAAGVTAGGAAHQSLIFE